MRRIVRLFVILSALFVAGDTVRAASSCIADAREIALYAHYHSRLTDVATCTAQVAMDINYQF